MTNAIEFCAFPDLSCTDFTTLESWIFQLRAPRGGGSITKLLEELGIQHVQPAMGIDLDRDRPWILELKRYQSPRTGWKSLTFRANAAAIALLHANTLESEFSEIQQNLRQVVAACHTKAGAVRTGKVVLKFEPAWPQTHLTPKLQPVMAQA